MDLKAHSMPLSMPEITKRAEAFDYNPLISIKYWLRTADALQKEASIYEREGDDQQAYLLLFRRAKLVLECLSTHPERNRVEFRESLRAAEKQTQKTLGQLEVLKPKIAARYNQYARQLRDQAARRSALPMEQGQKRLRSESASDISSPTDAIDHDLTGFAKPIAAEENGDLAIKLAHKELKRRRADRLGISEAEEQERRSGGVWVNWEQELAGRGGVSNGIGTSIADPGDIISRDDLTRLHEQAMRTTAGRDGREIIKSYDGPSRKYGGQAGTHYHYPNVPKRVSGEVWIPTSKLISRDPPSPSHGILKQAKPPAESAFTKFLPSLPPKELHQINNAPKELLQNNDVRQNQKVLIPPPYQDLTPPPPPPKAPVDGTTPPSRSATATPASADLIPAASLDPSTFTFKPSAYLENGTPLRTVFLPPNLRTAFLHIAAPNTARNLETCGILCGTLISNALFISRLVIPEQESTSDTCDTVNEAALFEYCDNEDLMVLGWIHTHPTQTCFMSSRDLHTHCGYQVMMPESIAIVCAPSREPSWGIFRLTDPPGMQALLKCTQSGLFHPHGEGNIYTDALRPGHVFEAAGMEFEVVDLRPGHDI